MNRTSGLVDLFTHDTIDELFEHPPINEAELKKRLDAVDLDTARRVVVDRLDNGELPQRAGPLFLAVMGQLGIERQKRRLTDIALDLKRGLKERLWAAMALTSEDPNTMDSLVVQLGPEGMGILAELSLFELLTMQDATDVGESISTALEHLAGGKPVDDLLNRIESCRQSIGVSCAAAYGEALSNGRLAHVRSRILDLFVREASEEGASFLLDMRDNALGNVERRDFQAALLRLKSRRIDPDRRDEVPGYAMVGNCDGQGDFAILGMFENPDETTTVAELCLRAGADIRSAVTYTRCTAGEVDALVEEAERQLCCSLVKVELCEAAALLEDCLRNTVDQGREILEETRQTVSMFERVKSGFRWGDGCCCPPAKRVAAKLVRELLERMEYDRTWFFDLGDLKGRNIKLPSETVAVKQWAEGAARKLKASTIGSRLVAMAEHMAMWHYWRGEEEEAALLRALAKSTAKDFAKSPLVRVMLERSSEMISYVDSEFSYQFGDPSARQHFKMLFFQDLKSPTGRDLAHLDMTEAAANALCGAFDMLPGDRRPRDEEVDSAAFALGKLFADHIMSGGTRRPEQTVPKMSRALSRACRLTESERHCVLMTVVPSLWAFVEDVCGRCPVRCLERPDSEMSNFFFTPEHPLSPGWSGDA
jgi:hypothetical protein